MDDLLSLIDESETTLVGYTTQYENIKDELLSNISFYEIKTIDSSFSIKNEIRNLKLNSIFANSSNVTHILVDSTTIINNSYGQRKSYKLGFRSNMFYKNIITKLVNDLNNTNYKLIITSQMNKTVTSTSSYNFKGGETNLYMASLAIKFSQLNDNIYVDILKNRMPLGKQSTLNSSRILIK